MTKTLALITVHGMGETASDYYVDFHDKIKQQLGKAIWDKVVFRAIYYQDILQGNQSDILKRMSSQIDWLDLRKFLLYGFSDAASLEYKKEDIDSPYSQTQKSIIKTLDSVFDEAGGSSIPVVIVAQSLGCQVISSYMWDAQQSKAAVGIWQAPFNDGVAKGSPRDEFRRMLSVHRLYTTGCNIPIFVAGHKYIRAITKPHHNFKWFNFFDKDDVLGWPLRPLSPSYDQLVEDILINAGGGFIGTILSSWNPLSHNHYWTDPDFTNHLAATIKNLA